MDKKQFELIKEYLCYEVSTLNKERKKAAKIFVRTLRDAGLISSNMKSKLLEYIDHQWSKVEKSKGI